MRWADVFAFTSLRDTSGNVVLEALAAGVPVICLDHQGVHDIVTDQCGVKLPVTTPDDVIACMSESLRRLAQDTAARERLSRGASERREAVPLVVSGRRIGRSVPWSAWPADAWE